MNDKKKIREKFRNEVFTRDKFACRKCGKKQSEVKLDAHHITDRSLMPNGGYVKENGISLCDTGEMDSCHMKAETYHISGGDKWDKGWHPDDLYELIGSSHEKAVEASEKL